jgi:hypothetical protein
MSGIDVSLRVRVCTGTSCHNTQSQILLQILNRIVLTGYASTPAPTDACLPILVLPLSHVYQRHLFVTMITFTYLPPCKTVQGFGCLTDVSSIRAGPFQHFPPRPMRMLHRTNTLAALRTTRCEHLKHKLLECLLPEFFAKAMVLWYMQSCALSTSWCTWICDAECPDRRSTRAKNARNSLLLQLLQI